MDIEQIKYDLENKKRIHLLRIDRIKKDKEMKSNNGPLEQDIDDQSILLQNFEVIDELDEIERKELSKIEIALKKIQNGNYGLCEECGKNISQKRLKALPYAIYCIHCAS